MSDLFGYVGTYSSSEAPGTYRFTLDTNTGILSNAQLVYAQTNTKYSAWCGGLLATLTEMNGKAGLALIDTASIQGSVPDRVLTENVTSCFLTWHRGCIYTANYHDGHVLIYQVHEGKLKQMRRIFVEKEAGCHQVLFHDHFLLVPCLCLDQIRIFDLDREDAPVKQLEFPAGTGPRHGVFNADHTRFYLVSETSNELFTYRVDGLEFTLDHVCPLLPEGAFPHAQAAAIRLSADEKTLYLSVRGANLIVVVQVSGDSPHILQHMDSHGCDPWDLALVPGCPFLLCSNRTSNEILCFSLAQDGTILQKLSALSVPQCVGISLE